MLIIQEVVKKILQEKNAPSACPELIGFASDNWRSQYDLLGGIESSENVKNVVCMGRRTASNEEDIHPICQSCLLRGTIIIAMSEYDKLVKTISTSSSLSRHQ